MLNNANKLIPGKANVTRKGKCSNRQFPELRREQRIAPYFGSSSASNEPYVTSRMSPHHARLLLLMLLFLFIVEAKPSMTSRDNIAKSD